MFREPREQSLSHFPADPPQVLIANSIHRHRPVPAGKTAQLIESRTVPPRGPSAMQTKPTNDHRPLSSDHDCDRGGLRI